MIKRLSNRNSGFTLIELLVVIILISLLAIALIAYINPVEQRRKALDTAYIAVAAEYQAAQDRYYTAKGCFAWQDVAGCTGACTVATGTVGVTNNACLVTSGEAKQSLVDRVSVAPYLGGTNPIVWTLDAAETLHGAFRPASKQYKARANFNASTCASAAKVAAGTANAFYCVPDTTN